MLPWNINSILSPENCLQQGSTPIWAMKCILGNLWEKSMADFHEMIPNGNKITEIVPSSLTYQWCMETTYAWNMKCVNVSIWCFKTTEVIKPTVYHMKNIIQLKLCRVWFFQARYVNNVAAHILVLASFSHLQLWIHDLRKFLSY